MDKLFFVLLGVFALLYGIFHVTNLQVAYGGPICGIAALALGIVCIVRAAR